MTSANELAALADRLDNGLTNPDIDPCDRNNFAPPLSRSEWELIVAALRATSTAGVREALEPFMRAARIIQKRPQDYGDKRIASFGGLLDAHDIFPADFLRLLDMAAPSSSTNSEWNAAVEACAAFLQGWLDQHAELEIKYTSAREYAVGAIEDNIDLIRSLHRGEAQRTDGGVEGHATSAVNPKIRSNAEDKAAVGASDGGEPLARCESEPLEVSRETKGTAGIKPGPSDTAPPTDKQLAECFERNRRYMDSYDGKNDLHCGPGMLRWALEETEQYLRKLVGVTAPQTDGGEDQ